MPSKSKDQAKFWEEMYSNPAARKAHGVDLKTAEEWVTEDRKLGTKHLPNRVKKKKKQ